MSDEASSPQPLKWTDAFPSVKGVPRARSRVRPWIRVTGMLLLTVTGLYALATGYRVYTRKHYLFLNDYLRWAARPAPAPVSGPKHVFYLVADHFEPDYDVELTEAWAKRYVQLATRHRDSNGRPPQHSWFYPGEQTTVRVLDILRRLTAAGLGEVELHYHHGYDTEDSLRWALRDSIAEFQRFGFLKTVDGQTAFGFVHGNFGLDNSNGPKVCGVQEELRLLSELGAYADYSFPSIFADSQPPFVNTIYAARDDPGAKSYSRRFPLSALLDGRADLMMFTGPLIFTPTWNPRRLFIQLDDADIHQGVPPSPARADRWIQANVHAPERPDWIFVKAFAHSISSKGETDAMLGAAHDATLSHLERQYNDGRQYVLHYITAREAYNLVRAAMDGKSGDPQQYFDYIVKPYVANQPYGPPVPRYGTLTQTSE